MDKMTHWTNRSPEDFLYSIASDFIEQIEGKMEALGMRQNQLADAARVSKGYVSRVFKNPGNLSLETIVKFARSVGMKASILAYEDMNDPDNTRGPINADIFRTCWQLAGTPSDMWSLPSMNKAIITSNIAVPPVASSSGLFYASHHGTVSCLDLSKGYLNIYYGNASTLAKAA